MKNQIESLFEGYSHPDPNDEEYMKANCSCTLVRLASKKNIIIDTMTSWDGEKLIKALSERGLTPLDISAVVCTHGHSDHIGCNGLFTNAEWHIVGTSISRADRYLNHDWGSTYEEYVEKGFQLFGEDMLVFRTPGHTLQCVSVLVKNTQLKGVVGVVGDLFENLNDILDSKIWIEAGSDNPELQRMSRSRLAQLCDYIIPGHGPGFPVDDDIRIQLDKQIKLKEN